LSVIPELTHNALGEEHAVSLPHYFDALRLACEKYPPPFGMRFYGDEYRRIAVDPDWFAFSLMTNSAREGDGASRLWDLAASTQDRFAASQITQHAIDESRHSRLYLTMLGVVFPGAVDETFISEVQGLSPKLTRMSPLIANMTSPFAHPITIDDLIQMNIAEIRTLVHHMLQRPVIMAFCDNDRKAHLVKLLDSLLFDEIKHITYTAELIEKSAASDKGTKSLVNQLMADRLRDFNELTEQELGDRVFETT